MLQRPTRIALTLSFLAALLVANMSGPQYVYPTFGTSLTSKFGWSALQNSLVSTASFIGVSFSGPLIAWIIEHVGIKSTLRLAAVLVFGGPFMLAQTYAGHLPPSVGLCAVYLVLFGMGGAMAYLCALDSQSHNFKTHRGMSMGMASAALGLCGVVFSQIDDVFFPEENDADDQTYDFLVFMSVAMAGGMVLGSFFLGPLVAVDIPSPEHNTVHSSAQDVEEHQPLLSVAVVEETQISGLGLFTDPVGFALFSVLFIVLGLGYVYLASLGQILMSLPALYTANPQHLRNMHVSIFSLSNCAARAILGTASDILRQRLGIHRLWIFLGACLGLLLSLVYLVTSVSVQEALMPCTIMVAIAYGTVFGVAPSATSEFGTEVFARNWGWLMYAPAVSSQLFSVLAGFLYDREASRQGGHYCHGVSCFRGTFVIGIVVAALCSIMVTWAIIKKRLYRPLV